MPEPSQNKIITIPTDYGPDAREQIGERIVSLIRRRTREGLDVSNNTFASYSPNYDKTGPVNLRESGDMVADLEVISHGTGFITIGFVSQDSNDKAAYIQTPRGQKAGKQPPRRFVGISSSDLNNILQEFPIDI